MEAVLSSMGGKNLGLKRTYYKNKVITFFLNLAGILKAMCALRKGDRLVLQYPMKKYYTAVCQIARWRGVKTVTLIHDLGSFRREKLTAGQEMKRLAHTDYIIALNGSMKRWLEQNGCKLPIGVLEFWDYLSESGSSAVVRLHHPVRVLYASGGLSRRKNAFLEEMSVRMLSYELHVYGHMHDLCPTSGNTRIFWHGHVQPNQLIATCEADFGLVWDGDAVQSCTGKFGIYLQYNNPHKASLYIRCGLPLIVWRKAAIADFVMKHRVGICVDSLEELDTLLPQIGAEEYAVMKRQVLRLSERLGQGSYLQEALQQALSILNV